MATRLPLFPLNVVLFPGTPLPLHIFEPRYRQLLADCLEGDQRFGITTSGATGGGTEPGATGCTALLKACHQLPDGRSNIVVVGGPRFVVRRLVETGHPYLVAEVDEFEDDPGAVDPEALGELRRRTEAYAAAMAVLNDATTTNIEWPEAPTELSFQVSALLELPIETREGLLALRSCPERVAWLLRLLPDLTLDAAARARVHVGARSNGKGGPAPEIVTES